MSFQPNIISDEEPDLPPEACPSDDELVLPEELSALGSQLSRESASLTSLYPPAPQRPSAMPGVRLASDENSRLAPGSATGSRREVGPRYFGPALAALLVVSGASAVYWSWTTWSPVRNMLLDGGVPGRNRVAATELEATAANQSTNGGPERVAGYRGDPGHRVDRAPGDSPWEPTGFVHELSGPELEGFLDLLGSEDAAASRLSI